MAGASGAGKSTLRASVSAALGLPTVEIDSLYHGPGWMPLPTFVGDVERFAAGSAWVVEWQYGSVKPMLADRADLLVWLDHRWWTVLSRVVARTVRRRVRRQELWNGNVEQPLWRILTDPTHIVRWSVRSIGTSRVAVLAVSAHLPVVRLRGQREVDAWLAGPVAAARQDA